MKTKYEKPAAKTIELYQRTTLLGTSLKTGLQKSDDYEKPEDQESELFTF